MAKEVEYLGHMISATRVQMDRQKVMEWQQPKSLKELRGFLGLTVFYMRFIKNYGVIARPLTNLLKKGGFVWKFKADTVFQALKEAMTTTSVWHYLILIRHSWWKLTRLALEQY